VRDRASSRLWRVLAALPSADQKARLETLLVVGDGDRVSPLDRLRRAPTRISSPAMVLALNRLTELRSFGISRLDMAGLPSGRVKALARYAAAAWAASIPRMPPERRCPRSRRLNSCELSKATPNQPWLERRTSC
jgi:hypothetical protein